MQILYLTEEQISFSKPLVRGGAIHVRNVVEGLSERGHNVTLVDWNPTPERPFQESIVPRTRFIDGAARTAVRARSVGRRDDVDVVVSKTRKTYLSGLAAARSLGVPHVVHVGSSLSPPIAGLGSRLNTASFQLRLRAPHDAYFVVCEHIGAQLGKCGVDEKRVFDVRNAVDTQQFRPNGSPEPLAKPVRERLESPTDTFNIGYIGGLQPYKGLPDLIEALQVTDIDYHLLVAGDGPERPRLERMAGERATFLGSIPYEQVPALYHEFDVFVLPSHTEGLPRVVLEAQATATPVVATRVGGVPEVVENGETGLLCDPRRPAQLANALDTLATDRSKRAHLGSNGRSAVESSFTWEELYDRYERYLERITRDR